MRAFACHTYAFVEEGNMQRVVDPISPPAEKFTSRLKGTDAHYIFSMQRKRISLQRSNGLIRRNITPNATWIQLDAFGLYDPNYHTTLTLRENWVSVLQAASLYTFVVPCQTKSSSESESDMQTTRLTTPALVSSNFRFCNAPIVGWPWCKAVFNNKPVSTFFLQYEQT